jgi:hypothetical protein
MTTTEPALAGSAAAKSPTKSTQCFPGGKPCFSGFPRAICGGWSFLERNLNVVAGAAILLARSFRPIIGEKGAVEESQG